MSYTTHPLPNLIGRVARGREHAEDLTYEDANLLFTAWLNGDLPDLAVGALWTAYRIKGESVDELRGFVHAVETQMQAIPFKHPCQPVILPSYNGTRRGANLLPLLALILARCGVPVLLHGRSRSDEKEADRLADHDPSGRIHSADILRRFGISGAENAEQAATLLHLQGITDLPVHAIHPGLDRMLNLRQKLGVRSSVHTVVKLINPFETSAVHCAGVTHPPYLLLLQAYFMAERRTALCLRGTEGEPFANPKRRPDLQICQDGQSSLWMPKDDQPLKTLPALPDDSGISATCRFMEAVLEEHLPLPAPLADQVLCLLCLTGRCANRDAARAHLSGRFSRHAA
ncbi:MAG: DNA-binding protein YbiB [Acidithiobacillus sp.]